MDALLINWELTVMSFFYGSFVLKSVDSSNKRDYFRHNSVVPQIHSYVQSNQSNMRDRTNPLQHNQIFFLQSFSLSCAHMFRVY